jgi:hypothetical protein
MLKTGHIYHFFTAIVFTGLGIYLWIYPEIVERKGIPAKWVTLILILWGVFRLINGLLLLKKIKGNEKD